MRNLTAFAATTLVLGLSAATSMTLAEQNNEIKPTAGPVQMSNDQLDKITAGFLYIVNPPISISPPASKDPLPPIRILPIQHPVPPGYAVPY